MQIRSIGAIAVPLVLAASVFAAAPASAKDGVVRRSGDCTAAAVWKLKAAPDDGRLEVEFEVDSNRSGQSWKWALYANGTKVRTGSSTTAGRSGSFEVERRIADAAGKDTIRFRATRPATGEVCTGRLTI